MARRKRRGPKTGYTAPKGSKHGLGNKGGGPTSSYQDRFADMAFNLMLLDKTTTDAQLGIIFGVSDTQIRNWKKKYPRFASSIEDGKDKADANVTRSLYERARGYSHKDTHISTYKGRVIKTKIIKHYPPDTPAITMWLKNRRPDWRNDSPHTQPVNPDEAASLIRDTVGALLATTEKPDEKK